MDHDNDNVVIMLLHVVARRHSVVQRRVYDGDLLFMEQ